MDSDRSSSLGQDVDIHKNIGEQEIRAANHNSATTNGHTDTSLRKTSKDLKRHPIEIESSSEGGEERAEEGSATDGVLTVGGDSLQNVPLNHDQHNVGFFPISYRHPVVI
jgi:hypothetical protein